MLRHERAPGLAYEKNGEFIVRRLAGETLLVPVRAKAVDMDSVYILNETGQAIWADLDDGSTVPELVQRLTSRFDVAPSVAEEAVVGFLGSLVEGGLVRSSAE
jgi:hypothetical protein